MWRRRSACGAALVAAALATAGSMLPAVGQGSGTGAAPETVAPESVIGSDGRIRFSPTTAFPNAAIGKITAVFDGHPYGCTGFLIATDFVLTAGHCVFFDEGQDEGDGLAEEPESFTFSPGRDDTELPYGTCHGTDFFYTQGWARDFVPQQDFGGVQLDCDVGARTGVLGLAADPDRDEYTGDRARVRGYPVAPPIGPAGTLWGMTGSIVGSQKRMLFYDLDTSGGESGGPVFNYQDPSGVQPPGWYAMAVHTYGTGLDFQPCFCNAGTRITPARVGLILEWMT